MISHSFNTFEFQAVGRPILNTWAKVLKKLWFITITRTKVWNPCHTTAYYHLSYCGHLSQGVSGGWKCLEKDSPKGTALNTCDYDPKKLLGWEAKCLHVKKSICLVLKHAGLPWPGWHQANGNYWISKFSWEIIQDDCNQRIDYSVK